MLAWFVNELSLDGSYESVDSFSSDLKTIIALRRFPWIRENLFFSRALTSRPITDGLSFSDGILRLADRDFKRVVLQWLNKSGPFLEENRSFEEDDYFKYRDDEVTHLGLGEAARRIKNKASSSVISFKSSNRDFSCETIAIQHGLNEEVLGVFEVPNESNGDSVRSAAYNALPAPTSYDELLALCVAHFDLLSFSADSIDELKRMPFSSAVCGGIRDLLTVLQQIMEHRLIDGSLDAVGLSLKSKYFEAGNAWFSDESQDNKAKFREAMTFGDPLDRARKIACFWHGKLQTPQVRVHFEWPVPREQRVLKVPYIGPKISKH